MKLIHLTDTHLVEPGHKLYELDPQLRLRQAIESINDLHPDADHLVITGDLTHWGEISAYAALKEEFDHLKVPYTMILGNHDDRDNFREIFPNALCDDDGFVQGDLETNVGRMIFLDTNQPGTHGGWYCDKRLAWLESEISRDQTVPKFLFMHHPPFDIGLEPLDRIGLNQKEEFKKIVTPHLSTIRHLFFGHVHRPISGNWLGLSFSTIRATNHQVWLDFKAIGSIPASHEPPAYGVVLINSSNVVVHAHDFLDNSKKFYLNADMKA
jgi:3',5'-cyclic-AMP phosphodiesterase